MNLWDSDWSVTLPAIIACFGVLVGVAGFLWYSVKKRRLAGWLKTKGRLESYHKEPAEGGGFYYNPTVVFRDRNGREVRFSVDARWNHEVYLIGGEVPVLFSPNSSDRALIDRWADSYTEVIVLYIMCGFLVTGSFGLACFLHAK